MASEVSDRQFWPSKPVGEPLRRVSLFEYGKPMGMTRSLPGEGWYAWGWAGVMIWCGLWGWLLGGVYRRFSQGSQSTFIVASYMVFMATLIMFYRDGVALTFVKNCGIFMFPIAVWYILSRLLAVPTLNEIIRRTLRREREIANKPSADAGGARPTGQPKTESQTAGAAIPPAVARRREALRNAANPSLS